MSENIKQNTKKTETKRGNFISRKPKKRLSQTKNKNLPVEQVLHLQRTIGNRALNRLIRSGAIQAKLTVGKPDDIYEKEADSVADKVMSMPDKSPVQRGSKCPECPERKEIQSKPLAEQITPLIRRQADEEEKAQTKLLIQRQAEEEEKSAQTKLLQRQEGEEEKEAQTKLQRQAEEEEKNAQTKAAPGNAPQVTPKIESNIDAMKGGGQRLSESTRAFFEPRFGADFSQVRVHNNTKAAGAAQAINAKAFTTGKDIVFNSDQYSPGTSSGKRLLAHELTHVVQQNFGKKSIQSGSKFVVTRTFVSKKESRSNKSNTRQRGFNAVMSTFRSFQFPPVQRNDVERVTTIANQKARRIRNIRGRYFRLNSSDTRREHEAILDAVRRIYDAYWWHPSQFRILRLVSISRLENNLRSIYQLY